MQLYFIRHGQSENNLRWAQTGSSQGRSVDAALTPAGRQQAQHLARFLRQAPLEEMLLPGNGEAQNVTGFGLTHLYCSLMIRAVDTGTAIAAALGLPLSAWVDWHETGGIFFQDEETGQHTGLPGNNRAFFEANYSNLALPDDLGPEGWWNRPFEEREERPFRARRVLAELLARHGGTDHRVAVVSHGGFYNWFLRTVLDLPHQNGYWFALNNTAITRIDFYQDEVVLAYMNRADHLPSEIIS